MAASNSSLINTNDPNHVFALLTQENRNNSPLFKKVPLEIRLIIYEYAVAIDEPIRPRQVFPRSNKFEWGKTSYPRGVRDRDNDEDEAHLVVVSLSRTCRSIYRELEDTPVFYRVNSFEFDLAHNLHAFLAAIVPKRLAMIRTIRLITGDCQSHSSADWSGQPQATPYWSDRTRKQSRNTIGHILALLSRCCDLRELFLIFQQNVHLDLQPRLSGWDALANGSHEAPSFINLPFFDVFMRLSLHGEELHLDKALDHVDLKQSVKAKSHISGIVYGPIEASEVDFTGRNRIEQDMHLMSDRVSSRTRNRDKVIDSFGVVQREVPKYNAEGVVAWSYRKITGIRWNDSGEVELELFWAYPTRVPKSSWESFHAFPKDRQSEESILSFFKDMTVRRYIHDLEVHTQAMRSIPSPSDIAMFAGGLDQYLDKGTMFAETTTQTVRKTRIRVWNYWMKRWDRYIVGLEKKLAREKKEAAKAA
ncbi:hypothetical protein GL218_00522 [Daldinia childiae]|uniref:uncharacterized protein n=1 Tax=Daldinia childiae TaxID=326645 RepID=UPI00144723A2|nr:uncharacterized protein GL218_00522 [Daldinia childiae]KAF3071104.1 hypothetical protein GL218_00522 [Daldinia childiae]